MTWPVVQELVEFRAQRRHQQAVRLGFVGTFDADSGSMIGIQSAAGDLSA